MIEIGTWRHPAGTGCEAVLVRIVMILYEELAGGGYHHDALAAGIPVVASGSQVGAQGQVTGAAACSGTASGSRRDTLALLLRVSMVLR